MQTPVTEDVNYFYRFILLGSLSSMNGFLAGAEVALLSSRRPRLVAMAAEGVHGAKAALELLERPERLLSVVQLGVTLLSLVLGSAGEGTVHELLLKTFGGFVGPSGQAILDKSTYLAAFLIIAFPHVVLGEVVPKNVGIERAERLERDRVRSDQAEFADGRRSAALTDVDRVQVHRGEIHGLAELDRDRTVDEPDAVGQEVQACDLEAAASA